MVKRDLGSISARGPPLRLAINAIEKKDMENYMQMLSLKSKFITRIIGCREKHPTTGYRQIVL